MNEFYQKHKEELKKPFVYMLVGASVFIVGAVTGNLEQFSTVVLGGGCLVFGIRDIVTLYMDDKQ